MGIGYGIGRSAGIWRRVSRAAGRALAAGAACLVAIASPAAAQDGSETAALVTDVELERKGQGLRLRLTLADDVAPDYRVFALTDPWRIVADFPGTAWEAAPPDPDDLPDGAAGLRFGLFRPGLSRLVLELDRPMRVERVWADEGRFTLRLSPTTEEVFAASAGWPEDARWLPGVDIVPEVRGVGRITVALDPGHGGVDPGAVVDGVVEKRIVLQFAEELAAQLVATGRYRVFLTRDSDIFVPLSERVRRARAAGANIILSLHADVVTEGNAQGTSVYTLPEKSAEAAADRLAVEQNRVDVLYGADLAGEEDALAHVLIELAQRGTLIESRRLADSIVAELAPTLGVLRTRPHRTVGFRVLKAPDTPSVLVELGYLSSEIDRFKLTNAPWRERAAGALVRAFDAWAATARPGFTAPREVKDGQGG